MARAIYIYQQKNWPLFTWRAEELLAKLAETRHMQGKLMGKMEALGFSVQDEASLETLTLDVLKSTEIEGELLKPDQVRSSIARHLGMDISGLVESDRNVDGVVEMMLDAVQQNKKPLSAKRLFDWQAALFPMGRSGMHKITVGGWRKDETGPMQVVSGALGKEKLHYQAPGAEVVGKEMREFINWFNSKTDLDPVIKSAIAHLWFVTIHPFDDGNGRIARAIADMQLARADGGTQRFYSMSAQLRKVRTGYYDILEKTQKGSLDITDWLLWFLECLLGALKAADGTLANVLFKAKFWEKHSSTALNERQRLMLNKLLDGFDGKLTSPKWAKITKRSEDTALRDIQDLIKKGILHKSEDGSKNTSYELVL